MPETPRVLFATSEIFPFSKTGGLGDVMGALPLVLHSEELPCAVATPLYGRFKRGAVDMHLAYSDCLVGYPWPPITADVHQAAINALPVYLISRAEYFDRRFYYNDHKGDYFDNCERFIFFCRAVLALAKRLGEAPAIIHAHDWQTGLLPAYLHYLRLSDPFWRNTKSVFTIHNMAFQGRFASRLFHESGLPPQAWTPDGVEYWGDLNLLKSGIAFADKVITVSPSYAREILEPAHGFGLDGLLARRAAEGDLHGILNGADYSVWDPTQDSFLPETYRVGHMQGKSRCKQALIEEFDLDKNLAHRPVLSFINRLMDQKGIDLLLDIIPEIVKLDVGLVVHGEGDLSYEARLLELADKYPGRVAAKLNYSEYMAHRVQAGSDMFLMPSRYEPCGLSQIYALRYGTLPIVTAVGGLKDTVVPYPLEEATGFSFEGPTPEALLETIGLAVALWENDPKAWMTIRERAMRKNFSWTKSSEKYLELYRQLGL